MTYAGTIKEIERRSNENLKPHRRCRDREKDERKPLGTLNARSDEFEYLYFDGPWK